MKILVTGISGFIGGSITPLLVDRGHEVVGLVRDPERLDPELSRSVTVIQGDALVGDSLERALEGCDSFAWLLHSMEPGTRAGEYAELELRSIRRAIEAARATGVGRGVYLGGIVPEDGPRSQHISSRLAVERELLECLPGSTALRASIVIGARSRSFRFLVRLVERMPALPLPAWRIHRTSPVDSRDAAAALVAALEGEAAGASLDISCPGTVSYAELIELIAERMLVSRPGLGLPFSLTPIAGRVAAAVAGERPELIVPLMGSLGEDLLPRMDGLRDLGVRAHRLDAAIDRALRDWEEVEELGAR